MSDKTDEGRRDQSVQEEIDRQNDELDLKLKLVILQVAAMLRATMNFTNEESVILAAVLLSQIDELPKFK